MQSEQATHAMHRVQRRHPIVNTERRIAALKNVSTLPATAALAKVPVLRMTAALKPVAALPATAADPRVNAEPATADEYEVAADPATAVERRVATLPATAELSTVSALPATATLLLVSTLPALGSGSSTSLESSRRSARTRVAVMVASRPIPAAITILRLRSTVIAVSLARSSPSLALRENHARDDHGPDAAACAGAGDASHSPNQARGARRRGRAARRVGRARR